MGSYSIGRELHIIFCYVVIMASVLHLKEIKFIIFLYKN